MIVVLEGLILGQSKVDIVGCTEQLQLFVVGTKDAILTDSVGSHDGLIAFLEDGFLALGLFVIKIDVILKIVLDGCWIVLDFGKGFRFVDYLQFLLEKLAFSSNKQFVALLV